jgi:hypothetical protein
VSRVIGVSSFFGEKRTDTNNPTVAPLRFALQSPVAQGVAVCARIAIELNRERPEIPLLVGVVPQLDPVFDFENRKPDLTPRSLFGALPEKREKQKLLFLSGFLVELI